jgi:hypothetical protein
MNISILVGKKITAIGVEHGNARLTASSKEVYYLYPMSDYASCRLFHVDNKEALIDETITSIAKVNLGGEWSLSSRGDDEYVAYFKLRIATAKGVCTIMFESSALGPGGLSKVIVLGGLM